MIEQFIKKINSELVETQRKINESSLSFEHKKVLEKELANIKESLADPNIEKLSQSIEKLNQMI